MRILRYLIYNVCAELKPFFAICFYLFIWDFVDVDVSRLYNTLFVERNNNNETEAHFEEEKTQTKMKKEKNKDTKRINKRKA